MKSRFRYLLATLVVIILGILSRKISGIPLFIGDMLYAIMVCLGFRFLLPTSKIVMALIALVFCFTIELMQLYQAEWLVAIRKTTLGHYALGEGFLWSDIFAYTIAIALAFGIDRLVCNKTHGEKRVQ